MNSIGVLPIPISSIAAVVSVGVTAAAIAIPFEIDSAHIKLLKPH